MEQPVSSPKPTKQAKKPTKLPEHLIEEQITELKELFTYFIKDKSKKSIQISDLFHVMNRIGKEISHDDLMLIKGMTNDLPSDKLDFQDFLVLLTRYMDSTDAEQEIIDAFNILDSEGTGIVTANQLRIVYTLLGEKMSDEQVDKFVKEADVDGDEQVDYSEFVKIMSTNKEG